LSNDTYKLVTDAHRRHRVIVRICPERYPKHVIKKLHAQELGLTLFFVGLDPMLI